MIGYAKLVEHLTAPPNLDDFKVPFGMQMTQHQHDRIVAAVVKASIDVGNSAEASVRISQRTIENLKTFME